LRPRRRSVYVALYMASATGEECKKLGHAQRKKVSRRGQGAFDASTRKTSALTLLERSMRGRVPELIRLKRQLMAASPFAYFRGAAPVMAADLAALPNSGILCQICGDAHVRNLGAYAAPDGRLIFDINDFDETVQGPFEWDLKRMTASLVLAGRASGHTVSAAQRAATVCVNAYSSLMLRLADMPLTEVARFQVHRLGAAKPVHTALLKAERATPLHALERLTEPVSQKKNAPRRFRSSPPTLTRVTGSQRGAVLAALELYRTMLEPQRQHLLSFYNPVDVAFKVVGTGSVGLRDYCVYLEGNGRSDPLFLQVKEETDSAYALYLPQTRTATHDGQRVVQGQRAMQIQVDPFLGWTKIGKGQYLVRQLNDHKGSVEIEDLAGENLMAYADVCGELLARGHARSGDARVIAGYVGSGGALAEGLSRFAASYAEQTVLDWEELRRSGKVNGGSN
jgi:uncharacterized protein (DUF2252 family)